MVFAAAAGKEDAGFRIGQRPEEGDDAAEDPEEDQGQPGGDHRISRASCPTWKPRLVKTPVPTMLAMTRAVAVVRLNFVRLAHFFL